MPDIKKIVEKMTAPQKRLLAACDETGSYAARGQTFAIGNGLRNRGMATGLQSECGGRGQIVLTPLGIQVRNYLIETKDPNHAQ